MGITPANTFYTDTKKREVVAHYVYSGLMSEVARVTGVPETTLSQWKQQEWWEAFVIEARSKISDRIDAQQSRVIESAYEGVQDRINNGDVNAAGKRIPMKGKDLAITAATAYNQRQLGRNLPTSIRADSSEVLKGLAENLRKLVKREESIINVSPVDNSVDKST